MLCQLPAPPQAAARGQVVPRRGFIRIQGAQHYLWRAVDQNGVVLDILVQGRRDANAATRFFRRLLAGLQYVPRVIVTDKLRSYGARGYSHPRRLSSSQPRITTWT